MHRELLAYARKYLKANIAKCDKNQQMIFKRMYSDDDLSKNINDVIDDMPDHQLSWAMTQVDNTLLKSSSK